MPLYCYLLNLLQEVWIVCVKPEKKNEAISILKGKDGDQIGP